MLERMSTQKGFYSKWTGISLIVMAIISGLSYGLVLNSLYDPTDSVKTLSQIQSHYTLYMLGNIGWVVIMILDLMVSVGLYQIYKTKARNLALFTAGVRIFYCIIFSIGIWALFQNDIQTFMGWWQLGLFFLGFHLMGLFALNVNNASKNLPYAIAILLLVAGVSYSFIHGIRIFLPSLNALATSVETVMALPMALAELSLAFWLLFKGEV